MSPYQTLIFLMLGLALFTAAQDNYSRPGGWCPRGSPLKRCFANPCDVERCPSYPDAICLNDNPCEPSCEGHFYVEWRSRLSRSECHGGEPSPTSIPEWCPEGSPTIRCFAYPCSVMECPNYPDAKCLADNPCEPSCSGNFYLRRRGGRGQKLSQEQCQD